MRVRERALVHGKNLESKLDSKSKYSADTYRSMLEEIRERYKTWKDTNLAIGGPWRQEDSEDIEIVARRTHALNEYKDFLDQRIYAEAFDSRSNLHSTVVEEFLYYLFGDLVDSFGDNSLIGKSRAFKDLFFEPPSYEEMLVRPHAQIELKDHDFVIGSTVHSVFTPQTPPDGKRESAPEAASTLNVAEPEDYETAEIEDQNESLIFDLPAIAIECKTYLDKTMLEGSSRAAEQIKARNPNGLYFVVCERLKLTGAVNLRKYAVDQIYVLRQEKNLDREYRLHEDYDGNEISYDVVWRLFEDVRTALTADWKVGLESGLKRGWLL